MIARIDRAPAEMARQAIGSPWETPMFRRLPSGAVEVDWSVTLIAGTKFAEALSVGYGVVRLSRDTATKRTRNHPDILPTDYSLVQRIVDEGEWFADRTLHAVGFLNLEGQLLAAAVKSSSGRRSDAAAGQSVNRGLATCPAPPAVPLRQVLAGGEANA